MWSLKIISKIVVVVVLLIIVAVFGFSLTCCNTEDNQVGQINDTYVSQDKIPTIDAVVWMEIETATFALG
jgi:hypothetical protein